MYLSKIEKEEPLSGTHMELILISDSRLKIMLTAQDMRLHGITCDTLDKSSITSRKAFWNILDEAKAQTGFNPAGGRLFVQMYPSKTGGCELFVTKLGAKEDEKNLSAHEGVPKSRLTQNSFFTNTEQCVYAFDKLNDLLLGCRRLASVEIKATAHAYTDEEKRWFYLVLAEDAPILAEYNGIRCRPRDFSYILEHCRLFCDNALVLLPPLAT